MTSKHGKWSDMRVVNIKDLKSDIGVIFDVKSLLPKDIVDARL